MMLDELVPRSNTIEELLAACFWYSHNACAEIERRMKANKPVAIKLAGIKMFVPDSVPDVYEQIRVYNQQHLRTETYKKYLNGKHGKKRVQDHQSILQRLR